MRNEERWRPSKYVEGPRGLRGARDRREVGVGSRLIADRVAGFYQGVIPRYTTGVVLDLGCGKAPLYGLYRRHATEVLCVDWANSLHDSPYLDVVQDLNQPLTTIPSASADTVIMSDVLEHIRRPERLLCEVGRVLRSGGHLLMNVPFLYGIHEVPYDFFRYTRYALEAMVADAGLEVVEMDALGGAPEVLIDILSKSVSALPRVGPAAAAGIQASASGPLRSRPGRKISRVSGDRFPFAYGLVAVRPATPG